MNGDLNNEGPEPNAVGSTRSPERGARFPRPVVLLASVILAPACAMEAVNQIPTLPTTRTGPPAYQDVPYLKLGSATFADEYNNKDVHFKCTFVGEWTLVDAYAVAGIPTRGFVFLNHRNVDYVASTGGFGSTDSEYPPFSISLPKDRSDVIYELKRGEAIEVWGHSVKASQVGKTAVHVTADRVARSST